MRVNWLGGKTSMKSVMQTCFQLVLHCLRWWYSTSFALCFRDDSSIQWRQVLCLCSCLLREGCCWFEGQDHGSQLPEHVPPWSEGSVCWVSSVLLSGRERNKSQLGMFLVVTLLLWLRSRIILHSLMRLMHAQSEQGSSVSPAVRVDVRCKVASDLPNQASWRFEASGKVWEIRFLLLFLLFSEFETKFSAVSYLCDCHTGTDCEFIHAFSCARWRHKAEIISESADAV